MNYYFKSIERIDSSFLEEMLYTAIYIPKDNPLPPKDIIYNPDLYKYIDNWDKGEDIGYILIEKSTNTKLGAAWLRTFSSKNKGYGYISEAIPELSIAMLPAYRGLGLGTALINYIIIHLPNQINSISLSVDILNPARKLYRTLNFKDYEINNGSAIMVYEKPFLKDK